jgi:2,4-dienoyl-CoA reductase-like NADH-dependent reductase (Old Yellow Enzyme family)
MPTALDQAGIERVTAAFVSAGGRAMRAGFDFVEVHGAHGYLLHEFLSPLSNVRTDRYGGPLENRMRFIVEVARAVRKALPASIMMGARLSVTDWVEGGFNPDEAVVVAGALKDAGAAYICCSSGGLHPAQKINAAPSYQVPFAERIRRETGVVTRAVGAIDEPHVAEAIITDGKADIVALARPMLADPRWPWRAAEALGARLHHIPQYVRSVPVITKWVKSQGH